MQQYLKVSKFVPVWVYLFVGEKIGEWALVGGILVLLGSVGRALIKLKIEEKK